MFTEFRLENYAIIKIWKLYLRTLHLNRSPYYCVQYNEVWLAGLQNLTGGIEIMQLLSQDVGYAHVNSVWTCHTKWTQSYIYITVTININGLAQKRRNSIAYAMEFRLFRGNSFQRWTRQLRVSVTGLNIPTWHADLLTESATRASGSQDMWGSFTVSWQF